MAELLVLPLIKADAEKRLIYARAALEEPDKAKEIMDYASAVPEFRSWSDQYSRATMGKSYGNIRAMHNPRHLAGKVQSIEFNDAEKAVDVCIKVLDPIDWQKAEEGGYTGLSIGGGYRAKWPDPLNKALTRYTPRITEISLVDSPCIPGARIMELQKRDGSLEEIELRGVPRTFAEMQPPRTFDDMQKLLAPLVLGAGGAWLGRKAGRFIGSLGGYAGGRALARRRIAVDGHHVDGLVGARVGGAVGGATGLVAGGLKGWSTGRDYERIKGKKPAEKMAKAERKDHRWGRKEAIGAGFGAGAGGSMLGLHGLLRGRGAAPIVVGALVGAGLGAGAGRAIGRRLGRDRKISDKKASDLIGTANAAGYLAGAGGYYLAARRGKGLVAARRMALCQGADLGEALRPAIHPVIRQGKAVIRRGEDILAGPYRRLQHKRIARRLDEIKRRHKSTDTSQRLLTHEKPEHPWPLKGKPGYRYYGTDAEKQERLDALQKSMLGRGARAVGRAYRAVEDRIAERAGSRGWLRQKHEFGWAGENASQRRANAARVKFRVGAGVTAASAAGSGGYAIGHRLSARRGADKQERFEHLGDGVFAVHKEAAEARKQELLGTLEKLRHSAAHPGFKAEQAKIAGREGLSHEAAGAILAASARKAGRGALRRNPRLRRVGGVRKQALLDTLAKAADAAEREKVRLTMHEFKHGKLRSYRGINPKTGKPRKGPKVMDRKQAVAIALSQARRLGKANEPATVAALADRLMKRGGGEPLKQRVSQEPSSGWIVNGDRQSARRIRLKTGEQYPIAADPQDLQEESGISEHLGASAGPMHHWEMLRQAKARAVAVDRQVEKAEGAFALPVRSWRLANVRRNKKGDEMRGAAAQQPDGGLLGKGNWRQDTAAGAPMPKTPKDSSMGSRIFGAHPIRGLVAGLVDPTGGIASTAMDADGYSGPAMQHAKYLKGQKRLAAWQKNNPNGASPDSTAAMKQTLLGALRKATLSEREHEERIHAAKARWHREGQWEGHDEHHAAQMAHAQKAVFGRARKIRAAKGEHDAFWHGVADSQEAYDKVRPHLPEGSSLMIQHPNGGTLYNPEGLTDLNRKTFLLSPHEADEAADYHRSAKAAA